MIALWRAFTATAADNRLRDLSNRDIEKLREKWDEEAVEATLAGNLERARYIQDWADRL